MDNKNYIKHPSFNTNNIAKSLILQKLSQLSHQRKKQNIFKLSHLSEVNHFQHEPNIQPNESQFNDFSLKYGKSQTLKQSIFNKNRFNIYRRNKKNKWIQNLSNNQANQFSSIKVTTNSIEDGQIAPSQKNRSFFKHRKLINLAYNQAKIKTSPQQAYTSHSYNQQEEDKNNHKFVDQKKINTIANKLLQSHRDNSKKNDQNQQAIWINQIKDTHRKFKILPSHIKVKFLKNNNYSLNASHSSQNEANITKRAEQIIKEQEKTKQFYQAWDYPSPNSKNRNEIVQYTNQSIIHETITPSNTEKKLFSSKKNGKFNIRSKK